MAGSFWLVIKKELALIYTIQCLGRYLFLSNVFICYDAAYNSRTGGQIFMILCLLGSNSNALEQSYSFCDDDVENDAAVRYNVEVENNIHCNFINEQSTTRRINVWPQYIMALFSRFSSQLKKKVLR